MIKSDHLLLMDASADNMMVVDQLGKERSEMDSAPPYWLRNRHVRMNNNTPEVIEIKTNRAPGRAAQDALIQPGIEMALELVKEGKRVVISCSTKKTV